MRELDGRRPAAFFDLDRTLIDVNSGFLYARHEYRLGRVTARQFAESVFWTLLYHLALLNAERAFRFPSNPFPSSIFSATELTLRNPSRACAAASSSALVVVST